MAKTYTLQQFQREFPDTNACLDKVMELRYGPSPVCTECKRPTKYHRIAKRRAYACQFCGAHVYPCVGTPFEKSSTPLYKWFYAMYLFTTTRHGVPAKELERQLGVTYKCAWRMGHEIRKLMAQLDVAGLFSDVEVDETYVGGKRPGKRGRGAEGKVVVLGMKERKGPVKSRVVPDAKRQTIEPIVSANVRQGSAVHTDEWFAYSNLRNRGYTHETVNPSAEERARGKVHTNSIVGYWWQFKRSVKGTHIHISPKHTPKYLAEFDYRHNTRSNPATMFPRMIGLLRPERQPA